MRTLKPIVPICLFALLLLVAWPGGAHAYIDPGTGSYVLQLIIAGVIGFAFTLKVFWGRFRGFFQHVILRKKDTSDITPGNDE